MEIDYDELFGLNPNEGGQAQEVTAPASLGGQGQEVAEPANQTTQTEEEPSVQTQHSEGEDAIEDDKDDAQEPAQQEKQPLTPQQKHERAAQRRKQEMDQAVEKALAQYKAQRDAEDQRIFAQLGLKHPETKEPITSREEVLQRVAQAEDEALQKRLLSGKLTKEDLQSIIMQTPEIQALQQRAQQAEASNQALQAEAFEKTAQAELAAIKRYDPSIGNLSDIIAKPGSDKFIRLVQNNVSYLDAYRATWADEIAANAKNAGAAVARSASAGKEHLKQTKQQGDGGVEVPSSVRNLYKQMMPHATDAEIRAHYNQYHK